MLQGVEEGDVGLTQDIQSFRELKEEMAALRRIPKASVGRWRREGGQPNLQGAEEEDGGLTHSCGPVAVTRTQLQGHSPPKTAPRKL